MAHSDRNRAVAIVATIVAGTLVASAAQYQGWLIPDGGREENSPVSSVSRAAVEGQALYGTNCARCHGSHGKGNGPDSDYASDLTDDLRTELNTEGVLFYKIWNGRIKQGKGPTEDMPAFQGTLEKGQVWALATHPTQCPS